MGVNTDGEEMGPGSTLTDGVEVSELTAEACEVVQETGNEKSLHQDVDGDVGLQDQKPAKGTGIPLILFPKVPSQSSVLNTEHNKAQREHTDEGDGFMSTTTTTLQSDVDIEKRKRELPRGATVSIDTNTFADDKCNPLEECPSPLRPAEIMEILETETNDTSDAMYNTLLDEISPSDASASKQELPFNPDIDKIDEEGYSSLYKAALEGHLEGVDDLIVRGANPNKPSKGGLRPLHAAAQEGHAHIVDFLILQGADVNVGCDLGRTPLHAAAARGYVDILECLVAEGLDVNQEDNTGWTSFNAAVQEGHLEAVKYLMTQGAKQNRYNEMTPLYAAAQFGHLHIVEFFISKGADGNEEGEKENIPPLDAAIRGHLKVMENLIHLGSDFNKEDAKSSTPLNAADENGHIEAVKYLITEGAKQNRYFGMTPLYAAAEFGHLDVVKYFISEGADVNEEDDKQKIPLHGAATRGHTDVIEYLIQQGSGVNKKNNLGWTPFNAAVQYGHLEAVKYLMTQGVKQHRYAGMTPLYSAAQFGHLDIVKFFLSKGADVNEEDDKGRIPLHGASSGGHMKVMEYLIQQGSDVNKKNDAGWTPFNAAVQYGHLEAVKYLVTEGAKQNKYAGTNPLYAAARNGHLHIIKFLISKGADVNEVDDEGMIPLHGAASGGHLKVMEYLIQQGSDVNKQDNTGSTPFNAAVQNGHLEAVKYLMTKGAKQNRYSGMTPFYAAAKFGHLDIVTFFISNGADVNEENDEGQIPLHGAASGGHMKVMEYIIQQGSDVNKGDAKSSTPLNAAVQNGHIGAVKYLMTEGAKDTRFEGLTPLYIATQYDHIDVVNFLVFNGYDVNERNECGKSPLHAGCYNGNMDIVKALVQHNANVNEQDHDGWTPLHAAVQEGHRDVVDFLTLHGADVNVNDIDGSMLLQKAANADHLNAIAVISPCRGDPGEGETGDQRSRGSHKLIGGEYVTVTIKDAYTTSHTGQLSSQVDTVENRNECNQADNAKRGDDELSLKILPIGTHDDEECGREEHNPFIHAKLKYPEKGEQDPMLDQIEAMKSALTTNGADCSSPHGCQTWQYSGFGPPFLQTMETDGHLYEKSDSRYYSLIDENRPMREPSSSMNAGSDLPINGTSTELESFPTHPLAVCHQTLYDGNPVSTQGTSSNPGWKIGTKRRTSVGQCLSILALVQTLLQVNIALAIILAGSPVFVSGSDITERVTLQAGKPGMVPFYLPWPPNSTSRGYFTLGFEYNPRPFCINGEADVKGFKSPSQLSRFTTSVTDSDTIPCVELMIDNVNTLDDGVYVLLAVWNSFENVRYETVKKEIVVLIPPGPAKCFITLSESGDSPYEVHCRATTGSVTTTLSCYQNDRKIEVKGDVTDNGQVTSGIFWLPHITHFSCCSHDVTSDVSETMCNDFVWPHSKETTRQTVNTVPTSVTTPTPQVESHTESGACRQFRLPSLWHFTYLFVNLLAFATIY